MQPIVTDGVAWSLCRPVTFVSPAKTAEAIQIPLGLWTQVGPRNHVLDGVQTPHRKAEREILRRKGRRAAHCKVYDILSVCGGDAAFYQITLTTCYGRPM